MSFVIDAVEHQLGPSKHAERAGVIDVAPCEVDESVASLAVDGGAAKVEVAVGVESGVDLEFPTGSGSVTAHEMFGFGPDLHSDVDVVERCAVGITKSPPG